MGIKLNIDYDFQRNKILFHIRNGVKEYSGECKNNMNIIDYYVKNEIAEKIIELIKLKHEANNES